MRKPPEETPSLWLIHHSCIPPPQSTAKADKGTYTLQTASLSSASHFVYPHLHIHILSLCKQMKRRAGHCCCRQRLVCSPGEFSEKSKRLWKYSHLNVLSTGCSGFYSFNFGWQRIGVLISHSLEVQKNYKSGLILSWQDILTLHWISEKANSRDINVMDSEGSSNWDTHVTPCWAQPVRVIYYNSFSHCASHFWFYMCNNKT